MHKFFFTACCNYLKKALSIIILVCGCLFAKAQSFTGYHSSAYNGVYAIVTSPADILNHRFRGDVNLAGVYTGLGNNIVRFKYSQRNTDEGGISFKEPIKRNGKLFSDTDIFGPGFLIRLSDKHAFAITTRARVRANVHGVDAAILNTALPDTLSGAYINRSLSLNDLSVNAHAWKEVAFTYSRQIANSVNGVWKLGASVKYTGGISAASLLTRNLSYVLDTFFDPGAGRRLGIVNSTTGNITLGYTGNIDSLTEKDFTSFKNKGLGLDIGVSYEYRDEMQVYETKYSDKTANYIWKAGVSVTDIGYIRYPQQQTKWVSASFNNNSYLLDTLAPPADSADINQQYNYYKNLFNASTNARMLRMFLPATLHLTYDRYFNKWLGLQGQINIPLVFSKLSSYSGNYTPVSAAVTVRAEAPWGGVYLPVSYNTVSGLQAGAALRLGPLVIGSASILRSRFFKTKSADVYVIARIPFFGYREYKEKMYKEKKRLTRRERKMLDCPR